MLKFHGLFSGAAAILLFAGYSNISAGLIIASGDATPAYYASSLGNDLFFKAILEGGDRVVINDPSNPTIGGNLNSYYNSLSGVSSTVYENAFLTAELLDGAELFVTSLMTDGLSSTELATLNTFVGNGGSVMFMGDYTNSPDAINSALAGIGSAMRLYTPINDIGTHIATGSQIDATPLTAGVATFTYGYTYGVSEGQSLFRDLSNRTFMAYENSTNNNVPEPSTMILTIMGILSLMLSSHRCRSKKNI